MWTAARIKELREAFGDTQEQFAHRICVSVPTVKHWEQGKGGPLGPARLLLDRLQKDINEELKNQKQPA
ncbi:MAG TPA: helix-turn-helix domain-containing protein [Gemmataceae bacterium]|nr:helix-turn-helix domain-containing protein [Gemmataceae bacterium]